MKRSALLLLPIISSFFLVHQVVAQTSSESAQVLRDSVKQKVEEELSQIKKAVSKKAFLGTITSKSEAAITINNYRNEPRQALVTTDSTIKLKNSKEGTLKDLTAGDFILVMGDVDSQNVMTAKRLLVIAAPAEDKRKFTFGKITAVGSTITIESSSKESQIAKLSSSTVITRLEGGKSVKTKSTDIKSGDFVVAISKPGTQFLITDLQIVSSTTPSPTATP
jgi:hypothetical protein